MRNKQLLIRPEERLANRIIYTHLKFSGLDLKSCKSLGDGPTADIYLSYESGENGICEVKNDVDKEYESMWGALDGQMEAQTLPLKIRSGTWVAYIDKRTKVKNISNHIEGLILELLQSNVRMDTHQPAVIPKNLKTKIDELGIKDLVLINTGGNNECIIQPTATGGMVPDNFDEIRPWFLNFISNPEFNNSWNRLKESKHREKHLFIWVGSGTPEHLYRRFLFHPEEVPRVELDLPPWLTHVWIGNFRSMKGGVYAWLYNHKESWSWCRLPLAQNDFWTITYEFLDDNQMLEFR